MKMRKIAAMGLSAVMAASMVPALPVMADDAAGKVYYLNFKPEQDEAWQNLAAKYTEETGVPVTVVTAASGQYETTLQSEMAKSDAPTLFQVNGPVGLKNWKDYCYDLSGSDIYSQLTSDAYTVKDGDAVDGMQRWTGYFLMRCTNSITSRSISLNLPECSRFRLKKILCFSS